MGTSEVLVAYGTVTLIVSCVICAAFRGLILSGPVEQVNTAVGAAQYNVQYWCMSCDDTISTVLCAGRNAIKLDWSVCTCVTQLYLMVEICIEFTA